MQISDPKATGTDPILTQPAILQFTDLGYIGDGLLNGYMRTIIQRSNIDRLDPALFVRLVLLKLVEISPKYLRFQEDLMPGDGTPLFQALHSLVKDAVKTGKYHHVRRLGMSFCTLSITIKSLSSVIAEVSFGTGPKLTVRISPSKYILIHL